MATVHLEAISKTFGSGPAALRSVDLSIADGEFLVLVGPSGCGKSTLLRLIAGLDSPTSGRIFIGDTDATQLSPQARDVAMVFQTYALYPHMTVRDNLAYGLRVRGTDAAVITKRIIEVAAALDLKALLDRRPAQLSGGQRQRVALGRAIVRQPRAFLFDEPLSNLDPALRTQARTELRRLHDRLRATIVYVTHDQEEAMTLADRVAVMRDGVIEQVGPPLEVYDRPANTFVAHFIGAPPMNLVPAGIAGIDAPAGTTVGIRPQDVCLGEFRHGGEDQSADVSGGEPATRTLRATVDLVEPRGHDYVVHLRPAAGGGPVLLALVPRETLPAAGANVSVALPRDRTLLFDAGGTAVTAWPHD